ncbi:RtcB family protein [Desulfococcaceae bacterium OttesenSCG-928-F15]|nr:RtcB family protein [Desulfococcaceae bacterium OttesenSCG-928-F15]
MISSKELNELGFPHHPTLMPMAMKLVNTAIAEGADEKNLKESMRILVKNPASMLEDDLLGSLAGEFMKVFPQGTTFAFRSEPAPWKQWGDVAVEESAIRQMKNACLLPNAVRGALMPDAHTGYGLPIGGVLAVKNAVIPYAVGVDIACRMRLTVLDMPLLALQKDRRKLIRAIEEETRFGMGASFEGHNRRKHAVMDANWTVSPVTHRLKDKAWKQLGTSGGGNHFVEFGELHLDAPALGLQKGVYLALLSHSGSRGTGETVASHYSKVAMELRPFLPQEIKHLAWLDMESAEGREYWEAMHLMGRYAAANHELIHAHILRNLGVSAISHVENHHNFAWKEIHDGEEVIVHRKGATPASAGTLGVVPGSMGAPGFVVRGKGHADALNSCSHGAGRLMSRTAAFREINPDKVRAYLQEKGVELISGGLDEAPMAYKDIHAVMAAQRDLVDILARFEPRLVKMASGEDERRSRKKKRR